MKSFIKRFNANVPYEEIRREARLQRRAAAIGISPRVIRCTQNTIAMENMREECIADKYGEDIDDIPEWIKEDIMDILYLLYSVIGIEYIDVTPYNFIEKHGVIWIIDFGHAKDADDYEIDPYLDQVFADWKLTKWNTEFA